ncbi:MAG: rhodanese-like domain-containing protein [Flavobacteriales bacterium]
MWRFFVLLMLGLSIHSCNSKAGKTNTQAAPVVKDISPDEFKNLSSKNEVLVIDVRTPEEIAEGYIEGADLFIDYNGCCFNEEVAKLDKNQTYVVYCRSGGRSSNASDFMTKNGFKDVYNLKGGITHWNGTVVK